MTPAVLDSDFPRKLGVKEEHSLLLEGIPADFHRALTKVLPPSCRVLDAPEEGSAADVIILWADEATAGRFPQIQRRMALHGALWVVIPKKASRKDIPESLTFSFVQEAAIRTSDLVDNKTLTFSETHYGIRFVIRKEKRQAPRKSAG